VQAVSFLPTQGRCPQVEVKSVEATRRDAEARAGELQAMLTINLVKRKRDLEDRLVSSSTATVR
jgi:hypothetical protein